MYSLSDYGRMIDDRLRTDAYARALCQAVKPGAVVLDLGTGTGILALLACRFGARKVYAIESDDAIQVAREIAAANGYAGRIEFIQNMSTQVTLPERAEVIISDLHGVLPLFSHHLPSIMDARTRFLAPGGVLIPQRSTLWAAVVEAPALYSRHMAPWDDNGYGLDMQAARRMVANTWRKGRVLPEQLLLAPQPWAVLDYATLESPHVPATTITWAAPRAGTAHGLCLWFDATLGDGIHFSNSPEAPELIYGSAFFPWPRPVALAAGDTVSVTLQARLVGEDYIWCWDSSILNQGVPGRINAGFRQSTFFGAPLSPSRLRKRASDYVPTLTNEGHVDRLILELMNGGASLGAIARQVSARFPDRFPAWEDALGQVGMLSEKYGV